MAKRDFDKKNGKLTYRTLHRIYAETVGRDIDRENRPIVLPKLGAKQQAIDAYKKSGREAAISSICSNFKRTNGKCAFSREQIDMWIDEYENNQKKARDDDDAR